MKQINLENVKRWIPAGNTNMSHPVSISTVCPKCVLSVVFATRRRHYDQLRDTLACSAECPSCGVEVHFWMTDMMSLADTKSEEMPSLYMMPSIEPRMDLAKLGDLLPDNVLQYCKSTQDVYESGNLTATRVMVQSALSAVFSNFLPHGNSASSLSKTVQDSLPAINIDLPLSNLAASLRKDGHLHALLNSPESASQETAEVLMSLVEKLVSFLFVIPAEFEELNQRLVELRQELPVSTSGKESVAEADTDSDADSAPDSVPNAKAA